MRVGVTQIRFIGEGSFFRASSGIFLKAAWVLYSSEKGSTIAGDLQAVDRCRICRTGISPGLTFAACGRRTYTLSLNYVIMVYHSPLFAVSKHFSTFFKNVLARIYFYGKLFVKVHRQTRRKSATQSYRDPPGQPVASKKLLFCYRQQICRFSRNRS